MALDNNIKCLIDPAKCKDDSVVCYDKYLIDIVQDENTEGKLSIYLKFQFPERGVYKTNGYNRFLFNMGNINKRLNLIFDFRMTTGTLYATMNLKHACQYKFTDNLSYSFKYGQEYILNLRFDKNEDNIHIYLMDTDYNVLAEMYRLPSNVINLFTNQMFFALNTYDYMFNEYLAKNDISTFSKYDDNLHPEIFKKLKPIVYHDFSTPNRTNPRFDISYFEQTRMSFGYRDMYIDSPNTNFKPFARINPDVNFYLGDDSNKIMYKDPNIKNKKFTIFNIFNFNNTPFYIRAYNKTENKILFDGKTLPSGYDRDDSNNFISSFITYEVNEDTKSMDISIELYWQDRQLFTLNNKAIDYDSMVVKNKVSLTLASNEATDVNDFLRIIFDYYREDGLFFPMYMVLDGHLTDSEKAFLMNNCNYNFFPPFTNERFNVPVDFDLEKMEALPGATSDDTKEESE